MGDAQRGIIMEALELILKSNNKFVHVHLNVFQGHNYTFNVVDSVSSGITKDKGGTHERDQHAATDGMEFLGNSDLENSHLHLNVFQGDNYVFSGVGSGSSASPEAPGETPFVYPFTGPILDKHFPSLEKQWLARMTKMCQQPEACRDERILHSS